MEWRSKNADFSQAFKSKNLIKKNKQTYVLK